MGYKILEDLRKIINEILIKNQKKPLESINRKMSLTDDIGFDSLDLAVLTVHIEKKYGVDIFEKEIIVTVNQVMNLIEH